MNTLLTISPWSVVTSTLARLKESVTALPRLTRSAKARRLAFLILPSAFLLLSPARAETPSATTLPAVDHYVHLSFLPKASELVQDAKKNNLTILRIDELADRVIVAYKYPDGHEATLGYVLLDSRAPAASPQPVTVTSSANVSTARYTVAERDPEVIYVSRPTTTSVVYYNDPYYYSAWAPWTVGFGLGWSTAYYGGPYYYGGGHYHGGYHGGGHGGYHGGGYHGGHGGGGSHGGGSHGGGGHGRR